MEAILCFWSFLKAFGLTSPLWIAWAFAAYAIHQERFSLRTFFVFITAEAVGIVLAMRATQGL